MPASVKPFSPLHGFAWRPRWGVPLIFGLTLLVYGPALGGAFIWDDAGHVTRADLRSFAGLARIWFEVGATQQYYPLLHSTFWIEHHLWGDAPLGYHLINVLWHATAACLVGAILQRLAVRGAGLAALLFALHPVCVESVAWISEQKNTLSAVLYLSAAMVYLKFDTERRPAHYALATLLFVLALFSKTVTATLPAALLVIFWWKRPGLNARRDVLPLLPWFALAGGAGCLTAWVEHRFIGAQGAEFSLSVLQRALLAGRIAWFYAGKLFWPLDLCFNYRRWSIDPTVPWQWLFSLGGLAVIVGLIRARRRGLFAGVLFFGGTLVPALGFINVYPFLFSFVADHFQYLACLGLLVPLAAGLAAGLSRFSPAAAYAAVTALLATLGSLTWQHSGTYRDVVTLYETTLEKNPDSWLSHNNLAEALANDGQINEAIPHLEEALRLRPDFPEAENNLGHDLTLLGRPREGIPHLERALRLAPRSAQAHNNLGIAFMATDRATEGMAQFEEALRLQPSYAQAQFNLGLALAQAGRTTEAISRFEAAVELNPDYAEAELNWAIGLMLASRLAEAVPHFERAVRLDPGSVENQLTFGRALAQAGRYDEAIMHYREALRLDPDNGETHQNLALALRQLGRGPEADHHAWEAQRLGGR